MLADGAQLDAGLLGGLDQSLSLFEGRVDGFLDQNVLPSMDRLDSNVGVVAARGTDDDRLAALEEFI